MEHTTHRKVLIPAIIIISLVLIILLFNAPISKMLKGLNFTPKPEPYTELYFNNPETLPKHIIAGQPVNFSFTIHNVEGTQEVYSYTISYVYSNNGRVVQFLKGTVTLPDNASQTVNISHIFDFTDTKGMVQVTLTNLNQSIDFLIPNRS